MLVLVPLLLLPHKSYLLYDVGAADDAEDTDDTRVTGVNLRCMEGK